MNPVKRSFYVQRIPDEIKKYKSGLLALSEKTMLGEPEHLIYAVSPEQEKELLVYRVSEEMGAEEAYPEVQIMKYDIGVLEKEGYVDEITTILSLMETDDRIEIAIGELMEEYNWYRG